MDNSSDITKLCKLMADGNYTLLVQTGSDTAQDDSQHYGGIAFGFKRRGVADLFSIVNSNVGLLRGSLVVDKVVGKGAAALMISGGLATVHTDVISRSALKLFSEFAPSVHVTYNSAVDFILNRTKTGHCPVETLCADAETPADCLPLIARFVTEQGIDTTVVPADIILK